jgi:hypothetical protein
LVLTTLADLAQLRGQIRFLVADQIRVHTSK